MCCSCARVLGSSDAAFGWLAVDPDTSTPSWLLIVLDGLKESNSIWAQVATESTAPKICAKNRLHADHCTMNCRQRRISSALTPSLPPILRRRAVLTVTYRLLGHSCHHIIAFCLSVLLFKNQHFLSVWVLHPG